jgi:hypothetical protein
LPKHASLKFDSPNLAFLNIELSEHASLKLARDPAPACHHNRAVLKRTLRPSSAECNSFGPRSIQTRVNSALSSFFRRYFRARCSLICIALAVSITITLFAAHGTAEQVPVTQKQGAIHGFLIMRDQDGKEIAVGDETNDVRGSVVHSRTIFRFRDGSIDDEETWYRQGATFQLIRNHHIQKGPSFPRSMDIAIDVPSGEVTWLDMSNKTDTASKTDTSGKTDALNKTDASKTDAAGKTDNGANPSKSQHMHLPADLANGMVPLLVQNFPRRASEWKLPFLAVDGKPRIVTLDIKPDGRDKVLVGVDGREADRYNIHTDISGIAGVVAPIVGKQPRDVKLWFVGGAVSTFTRMEGPFYQEGPVWSIMLTAPTWPGSDQKTAGDQKPAGDPKGE